MSWEPSKAPRPRASTGTALGFSNTAAEHMDVDRREVPNASRQQSSMRKKSHVMNEKRSTRRKSRSPTPIVDARDSDSTRSHTHNYIPEQLADLLIAMIPATNHDRICGDELADAFLEGPLLPPITRESLSELDIGKIIYNIKLRHDINFDRDLSFRPNTDGVKGQEKARRTEKYSLALIAELELHALLSRGATLPGMERLDRAKVAEYSSRRIKALFETISGVLQSLLPERDHSRIHAHLETDMLMQKIQRGACDLEKLAEWMAYLLKEHCAPMRDARVDQMVACISEGVQEQYDGQGPAKIVQGMRDVLGILEAMKLDIANHQIRNLKSALIGGCVAFEHEYHQDNYARGPGKVDVDSAKAWYKDALNQIDPRGLHQQHVPAAQQLSTFVNAVMFTFCNEAGRMRFPHNFYLDHERLRNIKAEIDDLIFTEICIEMFDDMVSKSSLISSTLVEARQKLRDSIRDILGDYVAHGYQQWLVNSEALSLEVLRHYCRAAGLPAPTSMLHQTDCNRQLRSLYEDKYAEHSGYISELLLARVQDTVARHTNSSPIELFNSLVSTSPTKATQWSSQATLSDTFTFGYRHLNNSQVTDLTNRLSHIILLHWRVWGDRAYVQQHSSDDDEATINQTTWQKPHVHGSPAPPHMAHNAGTGVYKQQDVSMSGQETQVMPQTPSR